jgi:hypothetical protein
MQQFHYQLQHQQHQFQKQKQQAGKLTVRNVRGNMPFPNSQQAKPNISLNSARVNLPSQHHPQRMEGQYYNSHLKSRQQDQLKKQCQQKVINHFYKFANVGLMSEQQKRHLRLRQYSKFIHQLIEQEFRGKQERLLAMKKQFLSGIENHQKKQLLLQFSAQHRQSLQFVQLLNQQLGKLRNFQQVRQRLIQQRCMASQNQTRVKQEPGQARINQEPGQARVNLEPGQARVKQEPGFLNLTNQHIQVRAPQHPAKTLQPVSQTSSQQLQQLLNSQHMTTKPIERIISHKGRTFKVRTYTRPQLQAGKVPSINQTSLMNAALAHQAGRQKAPAPPILLPIQKIDQETILSQNQTYITIPEQIQAPRVSIPQSNTPTTQVAEPASSQPQNMNINGEVQTLGSSEVCEAVIQEPVSPGAAKLSETVSGSGVEQERPSAEQSKQNKEDDRANEEAMALQDYQDLVDLLGLTPIQ